VLYRLRSRADTYLLENRLAPGTIGAVHANLDQLVALQAAIDFRDSPVPPISTIGSSACARAFSSRSREGKNLRIEDFFSDVTVLPVQPPMRCRHGVA